MISYEILHDDDIQKAKDILSEYIKWINIDLSFQNIQKELDEFPEKYKEPNGSFLVAKDDYEVIGCIGLREIDRNICEMKRLYVSDKYKGLGIGKESVSRIIKKGRDLGYKKMRLDTLEKMKSAQNLYKKNGFYEIAAYIHNPIKGTIYLEKDLSNT